MAGKGAAKIDIDNPDSWPTDVDELAKLAEDDESGSAPDKSEDEVVENPEQKAEADPEPKKSEEDDKAPEDKAKAEADDKTDESEDELPIATKDGKNTIPFSVLKSERAKAAEAAKRAKELETELEELRKQSAAQQKVVDESDETPTQGVDEFVVTDAMKAHSDKLREDWGDAVADQYIEQQRLHHVVAQQDKIIKDLASRTTKVAEARETDEQRQVQDAIDNSPQLLEWQAAEDKTWFERSVSMNAWLIDNDPEYASMSWEERFEKLPERTLSAYGVKPAAPDEKAPEDKQPEKPEESPDALAKKMVEKAAEDAVPKSMSDIPDGSAPEDKTAQDEAEQASAHDLTLKLANMSQAELEAYLAKVM